MIILKHGKKQPKWVSKCHRCGTVFQAKRSELSNINHSHDTREFHSWENCELCGFQICFTQMDTKEITKVIGVGV